MRLVRLHLRNFRSFEDCEVEIADVTILVGSNDAGKSSILDAVRCLLSAVRGPSLGNRAERTWELEDVTWAQDSTEFEDYDVELPVTIVGEFDDLDDKQVGYFLGPESRDTVVSLGVAFENEGEGMQGPFLVLPPEHDAVTLEVRESAWFHENRYWVLTPTGVSRARGAWTLGEQARFAESFSATGSMPAVLVDLPGPGAAPADVAQILRPFVERTLGTALKELPEGLIELLDNEVVLATKRLTDALLPLAHEYLSPTSRLVVAHGGSGFTKARLEKVLLAEPQDIGVYLEYRHGIASAPWNRDEDVVPKRAVPLTSAGSGTRRAAALAALERYANPEFWPSGRWTVMLLEEPEVGLHPAAQRRVARSLSRYRDKHGIQVIITTHSPVLINAAPERVMLVSRDETREGRPSRVRASGDLREVAEILGATPADVLLAQRFVVVEGETEKMVLPFWAGLLGADPVRSGIQVVPARGWSPSGAVARLLEVVYPGAAVSVILDEGTDTRRERKRIERASNDRVVVDLLPWPEIEGAYALQAIGKWLTDNGVSPVDADAGLATLRGKATKRGLSSLAETFLHRPFRVSADGAEIARRMTESDLDPTLKAVLLRHFVGSS